MDFVYICKPGENEELKYSIRSVVANAKFDKLLLVGGKPDWYVGDFIEVEQLPNKFKNTQKCLLEICLNKSISNNFVLMNDDFFILKPVDKIENYYSDTILDKITKYSYKHGRNYYFSILSDTKKKLNALGIKDPLNYDVHVPMVLNKNKLKKIINLSLAPRSFYGNYYSIGGNNIKDVKIYDKNIDLASFDVFLSTQDKSFKHIKNYLEELFPEKSIYEI